MEIMSEEMTRWSRAVPLPKIAQLPASSSSSSESGKRSKWKSRSSTITPGISSQMPPRRVSQDFGEFFGYQKSWHQKKRGDFFCKKSAASFRKHFQPWEKTMPLSVKPLQTMRYGYYMKFPYQIGWHFVDRLMGWFYLMLRRASFCGDQPDVGARMHLFALCRKVPATCLYTI